MNYISPVPKDTGAAFGRPHHKHKYPVGYKSHSLITINGIPMVSLLSGVNEYDTDYIFPLLEELRTRYPDLMFAYIILDKGYDSEEIHTGIYEDFDIIPVIIRKKMVYPKGFTPKWSPSLSLSLPPQDKGDSLWS